MNRLATNSDNHVTTWIYTDKRVYDFRSACVWIDNITDNPMIDADYISLRDLSNRNVEGNKSIQITAKNGQSTILKIAETADIDVISLTGKYKKALIVVGADLRNKTIFITLKTKDKNLIREIQNSLELDDEERD